MNNVFYLNKNLQIEPYKRDAVALAFFLQPHDTYAASFPSENSIVPASLLSIYPTYLKQLFKSNSFEKKLIKAWKIKKQQAFFGLLFELVMLNSHFTS